MACTYDTLPTSTPAERSSVRRPRDTIARLVLLCLPVTAFPVIAQEAAVSASDLLPRNLSPWGMFMDADLVVKTVMIGLMVASLITWTVLVAKTLELAAAVKRQRLVLSLVGAARTLQEADESCRRASVECPLVDAARTEWELSRDALHDGDGLKERVGSLLERLQAAATRQMGKGTGILATIGATAPFVGLFGTVWGIMNSFIGISESQTTNLAVVAPGIAEALLATALGLVAAIPAVVIYNHFTRRIAIYRALYADTVQAVLRLVSRDLSHGQPPARSNVQPLSGKRASHGS